MELAEIFCWTQQHLYHEAARLVERHSTFKNRYLAFANSLVEDFPVEGFEAKLDSAEVDPAQRLHVRFGDREFLFCFDVVKVDGSYKGQVKCLVLPKHPTKRAEEGPAEIGRFIFDGEGRTNIFPPGEHAADPIFIQEPAAALAIAGSFVIAGFSMPM